MTTNRANSTSDVRVAASLILRRAGRSLTIAEIRASLPDALRRVVDSVPTMLQAELARLTAQGFVLRIHEENAAPKFRATRPTEREGFMVRERGERRPECRLYSRCLSAARNWPTAACATDCERFMPPQALEAFALATLGRGRSSLAAAQDMSNGYGTEGEDET